MRGAETGSVASTANLQKIVVTHSELERIRREAASGFSSASHSDQSSSIDTSKGGNRVAEERLVWLHATLSPSVSSKSNI
jgi:hypothetical protein